MAALAVHLLAQVSYQDVAEVQVTNVGLVPVVAQVFVADQVTVAGQVTVADQ